MRVSVNKKTLELAAISLIEILHLPLTPNQYEILFANMALEQPVIPKPFT